MPDELVKTILTLIEHDKELGYRSHSEFIIEATRKRVEHLVTIGTERISRHILKESFKNHLITIKNLLGEGKLKEALEHLTKQVEYLE